MAENTLYYGDNLDILRRYVKDESIDLIYLDPPFNSNANYNVLFEDFKGSKSAAQLQAFKDTWSWAEAALTYEELTLESTVIGDALRAFGGLLHKGGMLAYLTMMAPRLQELHRVLKPTGSIYLHCDPTASHYLKILMDAIFSPKNFRNEIIWKRSLPHNDPIKYGRIHDAILYFAKGSTITFNRQFTGLSEDYIQSHYNQVDEQGRHYQLTSLAASGAGPSRRFGDRVLEPPAGNHWRYSQENIDRLMEEGRIVFTSTGRPRYKRYMDEMKGPALQSIWTDIPAINSQAQERLGYPTQKPEALLERIIKASSKEGDTVLDPFCGCGTATVVAQKLNRNWIGIDVTQAAIQTIKKRLSDTFGASVKYRVLGEPVSLYDASKLAEEDPYQFQWWSLGLVGARPVEKKKGADQGIDGRLYFRIREGDKPHQIILSVKAGHTNVAHVRDLRGVLDREKADIGVLISMQEPTSPMKAEAGKAGSFQSPWGKHPRIQLVTIEELLNGRRLDTPPLTQTNITFSKAPKAKDKSAQQASFDLGEDSGEE